jgi:GNAT superfamily N-acetyltransferase
MTVQISPVRGFRDLRAFVDLPFRLHRGTPWVPPLKIERYQVLNRRLNPYLKRTDAEYFLARRGGSVVGRITAQVDHAFNEYHQSRWGMFGFLEFEDDQEVLDALLGAAEHWLRARSCDRLVGPMDFARGNDEAGILIEGFEHQPMIRQPWHPPYYGQRCEAAGLTKAMDLLHWDVLVTDRDNRMLPILPQIAEQARTTHGIRIRKMSRRHLRRDLDEFVKVYNAAWSRNWGFVPFSKEELDGYALDLQLVFDRNWFMVAENDSETVAMAITIPDVNQALKKMNGRLLPLGWFYYLNRKRYIDGTRIGFLGVLPEYQHTGVAALLYLEHFDMAAAHGISHGEAGWILETNKPMNRGLEAMGARVIMRARVYERLFDVDQDPGV